MVFVSRCICNALCMLSCTVLLAIFILFSVDMISAASPKTIPMRLLEIYIYNNHSTTPVTTPDDQLQKRKQEHKIQPGMEYTDDDTDESSSSNNNNKGKKGINTSDEFIGPPLTNKVLAGHQLQLDQKKMSQGSGSKNQHGDYTSDEFIGPDLTNKVLGHQLQKDKDHLHMEALNAPGINQKGNNISDEFIGPALTNKVLGHQLQKNKDHLHMEGMDAPGINQKENYLSDEFIGPSLTNNVLEGHQLQHNSKKKNLPPSSKVSGSKNKHDKGHPTVNAPGKNQNVGCIPDEFTGPSITQKLLEKNKVKPQLTSKEKPLCSEVSKKKISQGSQNKPEETSHENYDVHQGPLITSDLLEKRNIKQHTDRDHDSNDNQIQQSHYNSVHQGPQITLDLLEKRKIKQQTDTDHDANDNQKQKSHQNLERRGPLITSDLLEKRNIKQLADKDYDSNDNLRKHSQHHNSVHRGPLITSDLLEKRNVKQQIDKDHDSNDNQKQQSQFNQQQQLRNHQQKQSNHNQQQQSNDYQYPEALMNGFKKEPQAISKNLGYEYHRSEESIKRLGRNQQQYSSQHQQPKSSKNQQQHSNQADSEHRGPLITLDLLEKRNIKQQTDHCSNDSQKQQSHHNSVHRGPPITSDLLEKRNIKQQTDQNKQQQSSHNHCCCLSQNHHKSTHNIKHHSIENLQTYAECFQHQSSHNQCCYSCQNQQISAQNVQIQPVDNQQNTKKKFEKQCSQYKQQQSSPNMCCCSCPDHQKYAQIIENELVQNRRKITQNIQPQQSVHNHPKSAENLQQQQVKKRQKTTQNPQNQINKKTSAQNQEQHSCEKLHLDPMLHIVKSTQIEPAKPTNNERKTTRPPPKRRTTGSTDDLTVPNTKTVGQSLKPAKVKEQGNQFWSTRMLSVEQNTVKDKEKVNKYEGEYGSSEGETVDAPEDVNSYVAMVEIVFLNGLKSYCTATAIHDHVLISAAHCFHDETDENNYVEFAFTFVIMGTKKSFEEGKEHYIPIEKVVEHPEFNGWNSNLALIYTFGGIRSDHHFFTIAIAGDKNYDSPVNTSPLKVASWGHCNKPSETGEPQIPVTKLSISRFARSGRRKRDRREIGKIDETRIVEDADILDDTDTNELNFELVFLNQTATKTLSNSIDTLNNVRDRAETAKFYKKLRKTEIDEIKNKILSEIGPVTSFRRQIIPKKKLIIAEEFILVIAEYCRNLAGQIRPLKYKITNSKEILCYYSPDNYVTKADAGAPAIQDGRLLAVTVGGVEASENHYGIGMKMSCYCTWIAEHLPYGGDKLDCCTDCCGYGSERKSFRRSFKGKLRRSPKNRRLQKYKL